MFATVKNRFTDMGVYTLHRDNFIFKVLKKDFIFKVLKKGHRSSRIGKNFTLYTGVCRAVSGYP